MGREGQYCELGATHVSPRVGWLQFDAVPDVDGQDDTVPDGEEEEERDYAESSVTLVAFLRLSLHVGMMCMDMDGSTLQLFWFQCKCLLSPRMRFQQSKIMFSNQTLSSTWWEVVETGVVQFWNWSRTYTSSFGQLPPQTSPRALSAPT